MTRYAEFSVTFHPESGGRYPVRVTSVAGGQSGGEFVPPVSLGELPRLLLSAANGIRDETLTLRAIEFDAPSRPTHDLGVGLFNALFAGDVRDNFMTALENAKGEGATLRIRLHFKLDDEGIPQVAALPWEMLRRPNPGLNLVQSPDTAVVRYLDLPATTSLPAFTPPLNVLFVMANPRNDLDLARERKNIEERLRKAPVAIKWDFLEHASRATLEQKLHELDPHVVHFMGHGGFDGHEGVLLFERGSLASDDGRVTGSKLGELLLGEKQLRLVVLNACRTAEAVTAQGADPYGGVAPALVKSGVRAVVAMQFPISDSAAVEFADRLYSSLSRGETIEAAVRAGRRAIDTEWPTPVLFSRVEEPLFPVVEDQPAPRTAEPAQATAMVSSMSDDMRTLLPYMVNRSNLLFQLTQALQRQDARKSWPLVAIVHGDDAQCLDMLQERLQHPELPRLLDFSNRKKERITPYQLEWPKPRDYRNPGEFHARLTWDLARQAEVDASTESIQRKFAELPAPVMINSSISSTELERHASDVLSQYVAYWRQWPGTIAAQRVLVFLFIKYQVAEGWLNALRSKRINKSVLGSLDALSQGLHVTPPDNVFVEVMPRLGGIQQDDVELWRSAQKLPLSDEDIRRAFRQHCAPDEEELPMETAAKMLRELMARNGQTVGGTA